MSTDWWKHEESLQEGAVDDHTPREDPVENGSHEVGASLRNVFGPPGTHFWPNQIIA